MVKKTSFLILIFFSLLSCDKEEFSISNLNGNKIIALGHGGMGIGNTYPMNTYESITKCLSLGMDGTELDVQMTKDSVLVAFHDFELSGSTNLSGFVNSFDWDDLKDAKYYKTPYLNYSIISLEQLFSGIENLHSYKFTFDCKLYTNNDLSQYHTSYSNAISNILQKYKMEENVYIESQSKDFLNLVKNKNPLYKLFIYPSSFEAGMDIAMSLGLYGITISSKDISKEQIQMAHNNNLSVAIWNTHSETQNVEAIKKNPDFIQTDKVASLLKLLK